MPSSADLTDLSSAQPPSMEENGAHDLPQDVVDAVGRERSGGTIGVESHVEPPKRCDLSSGSLFEAPAPSPKDEKAVPWSYEAAKKCEAEAAAEAAAAAKAAEEVRAAAVPPKKTHQWTGALARLSAVAVAAAALTSATWEPLVDSALPTTKLVECFSDDAHERCNVRRPAGTCVDARCAVTQRPMRIGGFGPLVLEPGVGANASAAYLAEYLDGRRAWTRETLGDSGALLFRGYDVRTPADFEGIARALESGGPLASAYQGTSPRRRPDGASEYVHTAADLPPWHQVPAHAEMSFAPTPAVPRRLYFYAHAANAGAGGETPVSDFRAVLSAVDPAVLRRLSRPLRFERTYFNAAYGLTKALDPTKTKSWQQMFSTADRDEATAKAREQGYDPTWLRDGSLQLAHVVPAPIRAHPEDGADVWHSHLTNLYHNSWAPELARSARHLRSPTFVLLALAFHAYYGTGLARAVLRALGSDVGSRVLYDDTREPPAAADVEYVRDLIFKFTSVHKHADGDVLALDNFRVGHARMPWDGGRRALFAAWNEA